MSDEKLNAIIAEAKRIEEDTLYSARGHFVVSRWCGYFHFGLGIPATITAALTGVSAVNENIFLSVILSILTAILAGLITFLNPKETHAIHLREGNQYKELSNNSRIFAEISCKDPSSLEELAHELEGLNQNRNTLNTESRGIPYLAFKFARKGIEEGEADYQVDN